METERIVQLSRELTARIEDQAEAYQQELYPRLAQIRAADEETRQALRSSVETERAQLREISGAMSQGLGRVLEVTDEMETRLKEGEKSGKKRRFFHAPPANSIIDYQEASEGYFAQGINFYKLALLVVAGSLAGVVVEMLWCLITNGYIESRAGLVYGPFNLLYGAGATLLTLALYRFRNRRSSLSFLGGMLIGSILEYACSWGQEMLFGSTSWDYSGMPFNLNGRICLLYSVFWGVLGVFWMKNIYPRFAQLLLKLPNRAGKIVTIVLTVFMVWNCVVSFLAVDRWSQRREGVPAESAISRLLDERFPDERMERIYANMDFGEGNAEANRSAD